MALGGILILSALAAIALVIVLLIRRRRRRRAQRAEAAPRGPLALRPAPRLIRATAGVGALAAILSLAGEPDAAFAVWALFGLIALGDLAAGRTGRGVEIEAIPPTRGYVGATGALSVAIRARRGALRGPIRLALFADGGVEPGEIAPLLPSGPEAACTIPLRFAARGEIALSRLQASWPSRLGLFEIQPSAPLTAKIPVEPDIRPALRGEIQAQILPLTDGRKDMRLRGEGSEFHQLRDFMPGMDPRQIDWKRSARGNALVSRETRAERNHQIVLCLDGGRAMGQRIGGLSRLDHALNAALALAWAAGEAGDTVAIHHFDSRPRNFIPPLPGRAAFARLRAISPGIQPDTAETNHTFGLSHLNGLLNRRSLIVVFSDFADPISAELLVENLAIFARRHLPLYISMQDPQVEALAAPARIGLDAAAQAVAARRLLDERRAILERLTRLGVAPLDVGPGAVTPALLSRYVEIKSREMI